MKDLSSEEIREKILNFDKLDDGQLIAMLVFSYSKEIVLNANIEKSIEEWNAIEDEKEKEEQGKIIAMKQMIYEENQKVANSLILPVALVRLADKYNLFDKADIYKNKTDIIAVLDIITREGLKIESEEFGLMDDKKE